jgi:hypothetical protein
MKPILVLLAAAAVMPDLNQLKDMSARFAPVKLKYDTSMLSAGDRQALAKLVEAARILNPIFMDQLWSGNRSLYARLQKDTTPLGKELLHYFLLNKGPWSDLDEHKAFIPGVPERKPLGANFYPADMTRQEFEAWTKALPPPARQQAESFFTVVRRDADRQLSLVPYNLAYASDLEKAATLLREAAALTPNPSLRKFLTLRADAFLSNDYYASDVAWMDLDAPLDITIGPYETYNDEMFGYKAAFEAYIHHHPR